MTHLSEEKIQKYYQNMLDSRERMEVLEHAAQCSACSERLADAIPQGLLLSPPLTLRQNIQEQCSAAHTGTIRPQHAQRTVPAHPHKEFCLYTAKVVFAMGVAILVAFTGHSAIDHSPEYNGHYTASPSSGRTYPTEEAVSSISEGISKLGQYCAEALYFYKDDLPTNKNKQ